MNQQQPQQQRLLPTQIQQQQTIPLKPVVAPQYTVHQQQHPINTQNMLLQSLLYHAPPAEVKLNEKRNSIHCLKLVFVFSQ